MQFTSNWQLKIHVVLCFCFHFLFQHFDKYSAFERKTKEGTGYAYNMMILSINMADFIELMYLLILFILDIIMGDKFAMNEMQWT